VSPEEFADLVLIMSASVGGACYYVEEAMFSADETRREEFTSGLLVATLRHVWQPKASASCGRHYVLQAPNPLSAPNAIPANNSPPSRSFSRFVSPVIPKNGGGVTPGGDFGFLDLGLSLNASLLFLGQSLFCSPDNPTVLYPSWSSSPKVNQRSLEVGRLGLLLGSAPVHGPVLAWPYVLARSGSAAPFSVNMDPATLSDSSEEVASLFSHLQTRVSRPRSCPPDRAEAISLDHAKHLFSILSSTASAGLMLLFFPFFRMFSMSLFLL